MKFTPFAAALCALALCTSAAVGSNVPPSSSQQSRAAAGSAAPALTPHDLEAWLDGLLPSALRRGDIAGAVIVVVKDGTVLLQKGYGYADVANKVAIDPQRTLFRPGSISKLVTASAAMQLVEQGKLNLNTDIHRYLDFRIPERFDQPITLRHLLTHTAGFEDPLKDLLTFDAAQLQSLSAYIKGHVPARIHPPGAVTAYSNYGLSLVGYLVQRVSGEPFEEYVARHVFGPLGMESSTIVQPLPARLQRRMARGYVAASAPPWPFELYNVQPAGALSSTATDMARFMIAHLQGGRLDEQQILRPATVQLMHTRAAHDIHSLNGMALGFMEYDSNGRKIVGHDGGAPTFRSNLRLLPDEGVGLFVSFNTANDAVLELRTVLLEQFFDRYFPSDAATERLSASAPQHAVAVAGAYESGGTARSSFLSLVGLLDQTRIEARADGTIVVSSLTDLHGRPKVWRAVGRDQWRETQGQDRLAMTVRDGKVVMIRRSFDPTNVLLPVPAWRSSAWNLPLLLGAVGVLLIAVMAWPVVALIRRHYGVQPSGAREALAHRWVRVAAAANLVIVGSWIVLFAQLATSHVELLSTRFDPWLRTLQLFGFVSVVGAAIAVWNARFVMSAGHSWIAKSWSILLAVACVAFVWLMLAFKLARFDVSY